MAKKKTKSSGSYVGSKSITKTERISGGRKVSRVTVDTRGNTRESVSYIMDAPKEAVRHSFKSSAGGRGLKWIGNNPLGLLKAVLLIAMMSQLIFSGAIWGNGVFFPLNTYIVPYPDSNLVYMDVFGYLKGVLTYSWNPLAYFSPISDYFAHVNDWSDDWVHNIFNVFEFLINWFAFLFNFVIGIFKTIFLLPLHALLAVLGFREGVGSFFDLFFKLGQIQIPYIWLG